MKTSENQATFIKNIKNNPNTSALEAEIAHPVYDLYGLTEEEIAIVEETAKGK